MMKWKQKLLPVLSTYSHTLPSFVLIEVHLAVCELRFRFLPLGRGSVHFMLPVTCVREQQRVLLQYEAGASRFLFCEAVNIRKIQTSCRVRSLHQDEDWQSLFASLREGPEMINSFLTTFPLFHVSRPLLSFSLPHCLVRAFRCLQIVLLPRTWLVELEPRLPLLQFIFSVAPIMCWFSPCFLSLIPS